MRVTVRGENTVRFNPYAIKTGTDGDGRWLASTSRMVVIHP